MFLSYHQKTAILCCIIALWSSCMNAAPLNWYDNLIYKDPSFSFELTRTLGYSYTQGADEGEVIATARDIKDGDVDGWYQHWLALATRLEVLGNTFQKTGDVVSAREAYFRASEYYRTAGFYMVAPAQRAKATLALYREERNFKQAIASLPYIQQVHIPYEQTTLPGYFIRSARAHAPLLIVNTGFDGTADELYFEVGSMAHERGYNVLLFEGPGQGEVIMRQHIPFRYDWEHVITPVVNYAQTLPGIDTHKIALLGISMGGYLVPRACAFEHRLAACIANGGVFDVAASVYKNLPQSLVSDVMRNPQVFNAAMYHEMKTNMTSRWFFDNGMWRFAAKSPSELMQKLNGYTMKNVAQRIKMPILIIASQADQFYLGQPRQLYNAIGTTQKSYYRFTREQAAQAHCQMGAIAISNERILGWLSKTLHYQ